MTTLFFFNDTATTEIYTLSLHDALPILHLLAVRLRDQRAHHRLGFERIPDLHAPCRLGEPGDEVVVERRLDEDARAGVDRKSTRLNSSHANISYAVFCLKKKKRQRRPHK